jgi:hypothetical protein
MTRYNQRKLYFNSRLTNLRKELEQEKLKTPMQKGDYNDNGHLQSPAKILVLTFFINRCEEGLQYTEELNNFEHRLPNSGLLSKTRKTDLRNQINSMKRLTHCIKN